jgi:hypothetical protein
MASAPRVRRLQHEVVDVMTRPLPRWLVATVLVPLVGCASASLPYTPAQQPPGARVSAAYQIVGDRLRIELDTGGRRVEEVKILVADGAELPAQAIDTAPPVSTGSPFGVGFGLGGGTFGGRGGVGIGTGVSVGVPVGGGSVVEGNTFAWFPLDRAGPAPWRTSVKLAGVAPVLVLIGGPVPTR